MRWMLSLVVVATLSLVYWVGTRIYWWRKAFGSAWTVTSEGASESLYAAGVLGLNDLTTSGDAVGKGTLPDMGTTSPDQEGQGGNAGNGSAPITTEQAEDCDVSLNAAQLVWEQGLEVVSGNRSATLAAWCRCQDRTYQEYFRWCDPMMQGFNG